MDPISIASACVGAIGTISKLSVQVARFVSDIRDARKDMEAVSRELTSLTICLASLRDDSERVNFPGTLLDVVCSCDTIAKEMADVLSKLSTAKTARIRWTLGDRDQISKLRSYLESHKSCIDVALDMASFQLLSAVKEETTDIKADTSAIKKDTSEIPSIKQDTIQIASLIQEIGFLRMQVSGLRHEDSNGGILLQRFLDDSSSYAESAVDSAEFQSTQVDNKMLLKDVGEDEDFSPSTPSSTAASSPIPSEVVLNRSSINNIPQLPPKSHQISDFNAASLHTNSKVTTDKNEENQRQSETGDNDIGLSPTLLASLSTKSPPPIPRKPPGLGQNVLPLFGTEPKPETAFDTISVLDSLYTQLSFLTTLEQMTFIKLFKAEVGDSEALSREKARDVLLRSNLPASILSQIWILSDTRNSGQLMFPEFAMAMLLCYRALNGKEIPAVLSPHLQREISSMIDRIHQSRTNTSLLEEIGLENGHLPTLKGKGCEPMSFGSDSNPFTSALSANTELYSLSDLPKRTDLDVSPSLNLPQLDNSLARNKPNRTQTRDELSSSSTGKASRTKPDPSKVRLWMDRSGSFSVEAQFLGVANGSFHLHKINGVKIAVPESKISHDDLAYVEQVFGIGVPFS